jgi:hypothetical protein
MQGVVHGIGIARGSSHEFVNVYSRSLAQCTITVSAADACSMPAAGYLRDVERIEPIDSLDHAKLIEAMQIDEVRKIVEAMQNVHGDEVAQGLHTGS